MERVVDTLALARKKHPGQQNSLDALCDRYRIDRTKRVKHGALLDAEILVEIYSELTGGRQRSLRSTTARDFAGAARSSRPCATSSRVRPALRASGPRRRRRTPHSRRHARRAARLASVSPPPRRADRDRR